MLSGCAGLGTYNPATGRRELIFISPSEELAMGREIHQKLEKQYRFDYRQDDVRRVERVGQKLAQVSDRQDFAYQFFIIQSKELNAFTVPGGQIYIYTGLLHKLTTDDELAAVLAHEIGHTAAKHAVKKFQAAMGYDLISRLVFSRLTAGAQAKQLAEMSTGMLMNVIFSAYSREDEYQADRLGLKYMDLAGYDPDGMIKVFEILQQASKGPHTPLFLRTHPYLKDRIARAREIIRQDYAHHPTGGAS